MKATSLMRWKNWSSEVSAKCDPTVLSRSKSLLALSAQLRWHVNPKCLRYVADVKRLFLERRCVQSSFTAADEKPALALFRRGVSLIQIDRAILLGSLRKYISALQNAGGTLISSLDYFTNLFEEVQQELSSQYWTISPRGEDIGAKLTWVSCHGKR